MPELIRSRGSDQPRAAARTILHGPPSADSPRPSYKVERSSKPNAIHITLLQSDGSLSRLPTKTTRVIDEDLKVNYYEEAKPETVKHWRNFVGGYLAATVLPKDSEFRVVPSQCYLRNFPEGYRLYKQKKGDKDVPRTDALLYGSTAGGIFRSPEEFCLHARWLMLGMPLKPNGKPDCPCIFCCKRSVGQKHLNVKYNIIDRTSGRARRPKKKKSLDFSKMHIKDYRKFSPEPSTSGANNSPPIRTPSEFTADKENKGDKAPIRWFPNDSH